MQTTPTSLTDRIALYERIIAQVDNLIATYTIDGQHTTSIGGAMFSYATVDDLLKLRSRYALMLASAVAQRDGGNPYRVRYILP